MSTYASPKERERGPDQCVLRTFGVLYRWLDQWTRLPANILMPHVLESRTESPIDPSHCHDTLITRHMSRADICLGSNGELASSHELFNGSVRDL